MRVFGAASVPLQYSFLLSAIGSFSFNLKPDVRFGHKLKTMTKSVDKASTNSCLPRRWSPDLDG